MLRGAVAAAALVGGIFCFRLGTGDGGVALSSCCRECRFLASFPLQETPFWVWSDLVAPSDVYYNSSCLYLGWYNSRVSCYPFFLQSS